MVEAESSRGGSDSDSSPRNSHFPCDIGARDAKGTIAFAAKSLTCVLSFFARVRVEMDKVQNYLRRALRDFESGVVVFDLGLSSLADRIERCEMSDLIGLQRGDDR